MMLQQTRQQNRSIIFLHLGRLVDQQHVLVVREVKFPAGFLIFIAHVV